MRSFFRAMYLSLQNCHSKILVCRSQPRVGRDNVNEQNNPDIRMGDSTVMLSAAKHLSAQRDRPFAALRVTVEEPISSSVLFFETA